jgi:hypothetical protein
VNPILSERCPPSWFENIPKGDSEFGYAVSLETSRDMNLALTAAKRRAQVDVAGTMQTFVASVTEVLYEELLTQQDTLITDVFLDMQTSVIRAKIQGVAVEKQIACEDVERGRFTAYVMVRYPRRALVKQLISDVEADSTLRHFLEGKPSFEELKQY